MQVSPYLFLYGRCEEAIDFYLQATGGELLSKMKFGDMPDQGEQVGDQSAAPQPPEKIMHAQLRIGDGELMLSDGNTEKPPASEHAGYAVSLSTNDVEEGKAWFEKLSAGGKVTTEWQETFWSNGFAMFIDKFNIPWRINVEKPQE
ncbi:VOC family metalloprotein YjdN [Pantoea sp. Bo_2]|uniref:VOC family metalloprotein YjdN n=1 Tax=Candidatus Pantoea gossypiicola TaxID=2608008 RepID=A0AB34CGW5_9GAMM|nr:MULTISPECIES: VOC family metalloprotein YjdN [Pantoea]KAA5928216.1 VOC family metalloprotein YjdN [Pantoea sp. VH_8]KAA5933296.1 VOC family metalloprotein YjdN [Pantoea sp. VH_4]KAA5947974.1 VOC family metalloprotein YjdN [Pantoea sp. VH_3]KAA5952625.1 VOC family metalloprotein YjdN [Pantoea sp. VH_25]KAA5958347.1 VOC family metalloprotein YjdN [Pantoea sp. VH_24]